MTLRELYAAHSGKVSDKWSSYLDAYERWFAPYREAPVTLVEVGVQNGGSLELWAQYFPNALSITGVDVDPRCGALRFSDARIKVIVGAAATEPTFDQVVGRAPGIDLFIDDGSHTSRDIIDTFAHYFAYVKPGGLYVVEDLHCSYLAQWGGGVGRDNTSMEFLKTLAEWVNRRWWETQLAPGALLDPFFPAGPRPDPGIFASIQGVTFYDSFCVVEKRAANVLPGVGARVIAGNDAAVDAAPLQLKQ